MGIDLDDASMALFNVYTKLWEWSDLGLSMPGYTRGFGSPYLALLLGFGEAGALVHGARLRKDHLPLLRALNGPHGWAVLQVLIIKAKERGFLNEQTTA